MQTFFLTSPFLCIFSFPSSFFFFSSSLSLLHFSFLPQFFFLLLIFSFSLFLIYSPTLPHFLSPSLSSSFILSLPLSLFLIYSPTLPLFLIYSPHPQSSFTPSFLLSLRSETSTFATRTTAVSQIRCLLAASPLTLWPYKAQMNSGDLGEGVEILFILFVYFIFYFWDNTLLVICVEVHLFYLFFYYWHSLNTCNNLCFELRPWECIYFIFYFWDWLNNDNTLLVILFGSGFYYLFWTLTN